MSRSQVEIFSQETFKAIKKAAEGHINVEVDGIKKKFPVSRAEVRANDIVLDFDMSEGNPGENSFIGVVIKKTLLNEKVEFVGPGDPVYLLFQNRVQEWVAERGWIRVEYQEGSKKIAGLLDNVQSNQEDNSKLTLGKFEIMLA